MRLFAASLLLSTFLLGAQLASAESRCPPPPSPLALFDTEPDVVRVRVIPGSSAAAMGGNSYSFVVLETLRGSIKAGATLTGGSGGPCARPLVEGTEYVFALGHANDIGEGRVYAGTLELLPTSIALQTAIAKTKPDDVRGRAALIYRAATARTATKADRLSLLAYLVAKPELAGSLTAAQLRRLDTLFADGKKARPELAEAWKKLVTR